MRKLLWLVAPVDASHVIVFDSPPKQEIVTKHTSDGSTITTRSWVGGKPVWLDLFPFGDRNNDRVYVVTVSVEPVRG